jgi:hypothetical protein
MVFILLASLGISLGEKIVKINMDNTPPNPPVIDGPKSGDIKEYYVYYFTLTDPDEEDYLSKLEVDFGDGVIVEDCGCNVPWENGITVEVENMWKKSGDYEIKARVADVYNYWSEWSEPYPVSMPRIRLFQNHILQRLITLFPMLNQILT